MALTQLKLTENHIKLLKHLDWEIDKNNSIYCKTDIDTPYGGLSLYEDIGLIIYGQPEGDFDPLSPDSPVYNDEQKAEMDELYSKLPMALEIILYLGTFEVGLYKRKWNQKNWKKY